MYNLQSNVLKIYVIKLNYAQNFEDSRFSSEKKMYAESCFFFHSLIDNLKFEALYFGFKKELVSA